MRSWLLVLLLGSSILLVNCIPSQLLIASFNIQVFGDSKLAKTDVMNVLVRIARRYDLLFVMEIRDSTGTTAQRFADLINADSGRATNYTFVVSPRLGRTNSKEQYGIFYDPTIFSITDWYVASDPQDLFEREPMVARISSPYMPNVPWTLIGCHVKPADVVNELNAMISVELEAAQKYGDNSSIIMGDFNADCSYLSKSSFNALQISKTPGFTWLIDQDSTVGVTACSYDRFIGVGKIINYIVAGSVESFPFDSVYGLSSTLATQVSDHYPIQLSLSTVTTPAPPSPPPPPPPPATTAAPSPPPATTAAPSPPPAATAAPSPPPTTTTAAPLPPPPTTTTAAPLPLPPTTTTAAPSVCGNNKRESGEACDDGNLVNGDGCSSSCTVEDGWLCSNALDVQSLCAPICGDRKIKGDEGCDDGNLLNGDGCSDTCSVEAGWVCPLNAACRCAAGMAGPTCQCNNQLSCGGHGHCHPSILGYCICDENYFGKTCDEYVLPSKIGSFTIHDVQQHFQFEENVTSVNVTQQGAVKLFFSAGSLSNITTISVEHFAPSLFPAPTNNNFTVLGSVKDLQPSGIVFQSVVTLTMTFDPSMYPIGSNESVGIHTYNPESLSWILVPSSRIDNASAGILSCNLTHFSYYAVLSVPIDSSSQQQQQQQQQQSVVSDSNGDQPHQLPLSIAAIVGIAVGGFVLLFAVVAVSLIMGKKLYRRKILKKRSLSMISNIEMEEGAQMYTIPSPQNNCSRDIAMETIPAC